MPDTDPHEAWLSASVDMLVRQSKSMLLTQSVSATQENMQRWVDAYNGVNGLLQADLNIQAGQDRTRGLSGDPSIKALQRQLRELIIEEIPSLGNSVRTLADIGLKTANNGSISFDTTALERALKKDPSAINGLFQATDGLTESIDALVDRQLSTNDGTFDVKRKSIEKAIRDIQDQVLNKEAQIEKFKESMTMRFTAMEQSVGASKSMGDYLKNVKFPGFSKGS
jgi:flagellar hook-associated protein 2